MLDVNIRMIMPIMLEQLHLAAIRSSKDDPVVASRFETLALLLQHVEDDKMWAVMLNDQRELPKVSSTFFEYWCPVGKHFWTLRSLVPQTEQEHPESYTDRACPTHALEEPNGNDAANS